MIAPRSRKHIALEVGSISSELAGTPESSEMQWESMALTIVEVSSPSRGGDKVRSLGSYLAGTNLQRIGEVLVERKA